MERLWRSDYTHTPKIRFPVGSGNNKKVNILSSILVGLTILLSADGIPLVAGYIPAISQGREKKLLSMCMGKATIRRKQWIKSSGSTPRQ